MNSLIRKMGFEVCELPSPKTKFKPKKNSLAHAHLLGVEWETDASETSEFLLTRNNQPALLVVDSYALDFNWEAAISPLVKYILVIDDLADRKHVCDFLHDQTYARTALDYSDKVNERCKVFFCGTQYALLRPEFIGERPYSLNRRLNIQNCKKIFISMGGMDSLNVTGKILVELEKILANKEHKIKVVLGSEAPHIKAIKSQIKNCNLKVDLLTNISNIAEVMADCDIAIGAGGGTTWERCCLGMPSLVTTLATNQSEIVKTLKKNKAVQLFDWQNLSNFGYLYKSVVENLNSYSKKCSLVCNGLGVFNLTSSLQSYISKCPNLTVRDALYSDAKLLFKWQINPKTRKYSTNPKAPLWREHSKWLKSKLNDPLSSIFLMELDNQPRCCLRLDWIERYRAVVSINVDPDYHAQGIGYKSLSALKEIFPNLCIEAKGFSGECCVAKAVSASWLSSEEKGYLRIFP